MMLFPCAAEVEDDVVDRSHLFRSELVGKLVEDHEPRIQEQHPRELDHELLCLREAVQRQLEVDLDVHPSEEFLADEEHAAVIEPDESPLNHPPRENVLDGVEAGDHVEVLIDHAHAGLDRAVGREGFDLHAAVDDFALALLHGAAHELDQG